MDWLNTIAKWVLLAMAAGIVIVIVFFSTVLSAFRNDSRRITGQIDVTIDGAIDRRARAEAEAGYGATIAGGHYSMGIRYPAFSIHSDSMPKVGSHTVGTFQSRAGPYALLTGGGPGMPSWQSDSGSVTFIQSDERTMAHAGRFIIWLTCKSRDCPCDTSPCSVRARGSFVFPADAQ